MVLQTAEVKESYNLPLSKKRAQHVKDYLVSKGLNKNKLNKLMVKVKRLF